ncbi:TonB-dependent receptor plug domain-containing protein [Marinobacter zhanjiangensis]|uniref:Colicin receptor n=1 Tax=Marinobacter zhanjiangensis TaxID=578215 RepID=A0ABQ3B5Y8_9GAMM|nr:TonB-dependent receptor [Marinobacter zhanjiangensis]GGY80718.1 colicin receptor [Marinobacter zhanjiangensis]
MVNVVSRSVLAVAVLGSVVGEVAAQTRYLDEVVVTGTRSERTVLDTPVRTEVVTSEEIERTHARDLREALANVAGLQLKKIHGKSGYEVWLQGLEANQTLVLVDGKPLNATTGSSVDVSQLSILEIDRIEIVKGAVSAQYGSSGMGGVINVITRPITPGWRARLGADAGSYGSDNPSDERFQPSRHTGTASAETGNEIWGIRVAAEVRHTDGIDPEPESWTRPGNEIDRRDVHGRLQWTPNEAHRLTLEGQTFTESSEARFMSTGQRHGKDEDVDRWRVSLSGDHDLTGRLEGSWFAVHEDLTDDTNKYTAAAHYDDRDADMSLSQLSGELGTWLGSSQRLQGGVDIRRDTLSQVKDGTPEVDGEREGYELWTQHTWMPSDVVEIVTGIRGQNDSDFGNHVAPKINARFDFGDGTGLDSYVRAGVGAGYRVPNLKERFYLFDHSQLGYVVKGNPDVEAEESVSYQLGLGTHYEKRLWVEGNAFFNDIDDLIATEYAGMDNGVSVYRYGNVNEARTWGLETTAGWEISEGWRMTAGYTWLQTEDRATGLDLNRRPQHQANLALDGQTGVDGLSWLVRVRGQGSEYVDAALDMKTPGYTTADLKLNYLPSDWLTLYGGVDNITDVQRDFDNADEDFRPVGGRYVYLGFSMSFDGM